VQSAWRKDRNCKFFIRQQPMNIILVIFYLLGATPENLKNWYEKKGLWGHPLKRKMGRKGDGVTGRYI
jgi:hypothetical protein